MKINYKKIKKVKKNDYHSVLTEIRSYVKSEHSELELEEKEKLIEKLTGQLIFGLKVIEKREELKLTQKEVAKTAGCSETHYQKIEYGQVDFDTKENKKILERILDTLEWEGETPYNILKIEVPDQKVNSTISKNKLIKELKYIVNTTSTPQAFFVRSALVFKGLVDIFEKEKSGENKGINIKFTEKDFQNVLLAGFVSNVSTFEFLQNYLKAGFAEGITKTQWELAFSNLTNKQVFDLEDAIFNVTERRRTKKGNKV
ncbi:MAG: helix-turn-helix domain-containing protein [Aridibacter sp.]